MVDQLCVEKKYYDRFSLIKQPESRAWGCSINAFSVACGIGSKELELVVGHNGAAVIDETIEDCRRFAGFTDTELILALWKRGIPVASYIVEDLRVKDKLLVRDSLAGRRVVVYFEGVHGLHAVAWYGSQVIDIQEKIKSISEIPLELTVAYYLCLPQSV